MVLILAPLHPAFLLLGVSFASIFWPCVIISMSWSLMCSILEPLMDFMVYSRNCDIQNWEAPCLVKLSNWNTSRIIYCKVCISPLSLPLTCPPYYEKILLSLSYNHVGFSKRLSKKNEKIIAVIVLKVIKIIKCKTINQICCRPESAWITQCLTTESIDKKTTNIGLNTMGYQQIMS